MVQYMLPKTNLNQETERFKKMNRPGAEAETYQLFVTLTKDIYNGCNEWLLTHFFAPTRIVFYCVRAVIVFLKSPPMTCSIASCNGLLYV